MNKEEIVKNLLENQNNFHKKEIEIEHHVPFDWMNDVIKNALKKGLSEDEMKQIDNYAKLNKKSQKLMINTILDFLHKNA